MFKLEGLEKECKGLKEAIIQEENNIRENSVNAIAGLNRHKISELNIQKNKDDNLK